MKYIALTSLILPAKHAMEFKVSWVMLFPIFFATFEITRMHRCQSRRARMKKWNMSNLTLSAPFFPRRKCRAQKLFFHSVWESWRVCEIFILKESIFSGLERNEQFVEQGRKLYWLHNSIVPLLINWYSGSFLFEGSAHKNSFKRIQF